MGVLSKLVKANSISQSGKYVGFKFLWKYRRILFLGLVFILITNIFAIYPAEFVRNALDELIEKLNSSNSEN